MYYPEFDEKTAKMLAIYEKQAFKSVRASQVLRLRLVAWVIRNKISTSLKRLLDVVVALIALVAASPVFLVTAILIKLESTGPVFFKQVRVGKWGTTVGC